MIRDQAIILLFILAGCGTGGGGSGYYPPSDSGTQSPFVGTWTGTLISQAATCSDGTMVPAQSSMVSFSIMDNTMGQVFWHAKCGDLYWNANGNAASLERSVTCTPTKNMDGSVTTDTISSGTLAVNGNALQVSYIVDISVAGTPKGTITCKLAESGTMVKQ